MNKFKVIALSATLIMATAGLAMACGSDTSAASAETASTKVAGACSTDGAAVKTASTKVAGAGACASGSGVSAKTVQIETVRMPSGSMAVFYNGANAETVAYLQSKVEEGCGGFVCDMAKNMAADKNVTTEIAKTENGVMILVSAQDSATVDTYEEQYAAITTAAADGE